MTRTLLFIANTIALRSRIQRFYVFYYNYAFLQISWEYFARVSQSYFNKRKFLSPRNFNITPISFARFDSINRTDGLNKKFNNVFVIGNGLPITFGAKTWRGSSS